LYWARLPHAPDDGPRRPLARERRSDDPQSRADFTANWIAKSAARINTAAASAGWVDMLASDSVGATWGAGVRRAALVPTWVSTSSRCKDADALP